jgi:hypothetical protein
MNKQINKKLQSLMLETVLDLHLLPYYLLHPYYFPISSYYFLSLPYYFLTTSRGLLLLIIPNHTPTIPSAPVVGQPRFHFVRRERRLLLAQGAPLSVAVGHDYGYHWLGSSGDGVLFGEAGPPE